MGAGVGGRGGAVRPGTAPRGGWRWAAFLGALAVWLALCAAGGSAAWVREEGRATVAVFFLLVPASVAVVVFWPRGGGRRWQMAGVLGVAALGRLAFWPHPPGDDLNRYLWEGKLVRAGVSPYAHPAAAPEWAEWRDARWAAMNHRDLRTIYPPVAQWVFAGVGAVADDPRALKLVFVLADLAAVAGLLGLLRARGQPLRFAGFYAFNPVPLWGIAGEAHYDGLVVLAIVLALGLRARGRPAAAWLALALAVQLKLVAIVLVPGLLRRGGWRTAWVGALAVAAPFAPYAAEMGRWWSGVVHFGSALAFNGPVHGVLWAATGSRAAAVALCGGALVAWLGGVAWRQREEERAAWLALTGLVVLSPTVHYWYLAWPLVLVPLFPSVAWLALSAGMAGWWLAPWQAARGDAWALPAGAAVVMWLPLAWLVPAAVREWRRRRAVGAPVGADHVETLAVVIPAWNDGAALAACLASVRALRPPAHEVIVADGGSADDTRAVAARGGARIVTAARGRGGQIAAGVAQATADVVLVLHADARVAPELGGRILAALRARPAAVGGAAGQAFAGDGPGLVVVEALNEFRAGCLGLSFGDQGQFFRREAVNALGGFPALPLMEDVELSLRLRAAGPVLYLGGGVLCSARRWRREHWWRRVAQVLALTARYRWARWQGRDCTAELYREYYPDRA